MARYSLRKLDHMSCNNEKWCSQLRGTRPRSFPEKENEILRGDEKGKGAVARLTFIGRRMGWMLRDGWHTVH